MGDHPPTSYATYDDKGTKDYQKEAWAAALKKAGALVAPKGSKAYEKVLKIYLEVELPARLPPSARMWRDACSHATDGAQAYIARTDERYERTRECYNWMMQRAGDLEDPLDFALFEVQCPRKH